MLASEGLSLIKGLKGIQRALFVLEPTRASLPSRFHMVTFPNQRAALVWFGGDGEVALMLALPLSSDSVCSEVFFPRTADWKQRGDSEDR